MEKRTITLNKVGHRTSREVIYIQEIKDGEPEIIVVLPKWYVGDATYITITVSPSS